MRKIIPILEQQLMQRLATEAEVRFVFRKQDGTERQARGTCNLRYIPFDKHPKREIPITTAIRFFDLDENAWRSFEIGSLLRVSLS